MPATRRSASKAAKESAAAVTSGKKTTAAPQSPSKNKPPSSPVAKTSGAAGRLKVGSKFPAEMTVVDQTGAEHTLGSLVAKNGIVIFFYPKANTPGCTTQACGFRDNFDQFKAKGYDIYGMSADSPTSQANWKSKHSFPYSLLSDRSSDRRALKALGVNKGTSISRSHIIIGKGGVVETVEYGVSPKDSVQLATDYVKSR